MLLFKIFAVIITTRTPRASRSRMAASIASAAGSLIPVTVLSLSMKTTKSEKLLTGRFLNSNSGEMGSCVCAAVSIPPSLPGIPAAGTGGARILMLCADPADAEDASFALKEAALSASALSPSRKKINCIPLNSPRRRSTDISMRLLFCKAESE